MNTTNEQLKKLVLDLSSKNEQIKQTKRQNSLNEYNNRFANFVISKVLGDQDLLFFTGGYNELQTA